MMNRRQLLALTTAALIHLPRIRDDKKSLWRAMKTWAHSAQGNDKRSCTVHFRHSSVKQFAVHLKESRFAANGAFLGCSNIFCPAESFEEAAETALSLYSEEYPDALRTLTHASV